MKKILNLFVLFLFCFLLTGCVKYSYTIDVNEKTVKVDEAYFDICRNNTHASNNPPM